MDQVDQNELKWIEWTESEPKLNEWNEVDWNAIGFSLTASVFH